MALPGGVPTRLVCRPGRLKGIRGSPEPSNSVRSPPGLIPSLNITCFVTSDLLRPTQTLGVCDIVVYSNVSNITVKVFYHISSLLIILNKSKVQRSS